MRLGQQAAAVSDLLHSTALGHGQICHIHIQTDKVSPITQHSDRENLAFHIKN